MDENIMEAAETESVEFDEAAFDAAWEDAPDEASADGENTDGEEAPEAEPAEQAEAEGVEDTATETEPEAEQPAAEHQRSWKLKHNGEEVDADEARMVELAQKGLDYDRVREDRDKFKTEYPKYADYEKFLQEMAESAGTDVPGLMENVRVGLLVKKAQAEGKTLSEAAAIQQVRREATARANTAQAEQPTEQQNTPEQNEETRRRENIRVFCENHPGVKAEDIPQDVLQEGIASGDLSGTYDRWEIKQLKEQLGTARKELETEKQNKMNKERSTGSRKSAGATTPKDDFDDAWDSF
jgi:hypothetical protein